MTCFGKAVCLSMVIGGMSWLAAPSSAYSAPDGMALIETTVPLEDSSEAGIADAVNRAVTSAIRGATAMGLSWVQLQRAYVSGGYVGVEVLAATESLDTRTGEEPAAAPRQEGRDDGILTRL
jgi:hypothetical protein